MIVGPENLPGRAVLHCGDCLVVLPTIATASVDSIVTDPPYGLEFMGKEWDGSDGFRRSLNEADVGRDSAFGRMSARAPEYRTAGTGQKNKPGIGARDTNQFRCATCGHLFHGGSPCQCADPKPVRADNRWNLFQAWCEAWGRECLRVLKPGGHLIAFGGARTYHRLACAIEDSGFEIRDQIQWLYGSGFPKSLDVSKAIDKRKNWSALPKLQGAIHEARKKLGISQSEAARRMGLIGPDEDLGGGGFMWFETGMRGPTREQWPRLKAALHIGDDFDLCFEEAEREITGEVEEWTDRSNYAITSKDGFRRDIPASPLAIEWSGFGTALKPACEPIVLARKPLIGTVAENVLRHGTGALNIDGCRIGDFVNGTPAGTDRYNQANFEQGYRPGAYQSNGREGEPSAERRYTDEGATNFAATPGPRGGSPAGRWPANVIHDGSSEVTEAFPDTDGAVSNGRAGAPGLYEDGIGSAPQLPGYGDSGSAARFFYTAKADTDDRLGSKHPTVKPVDLMAYLVRLVTPKGGTVLDPLAGTGTTGEAAFREGMQSILIEREPEYQGDIRRRMGLAMSGPAERAREGMKARTKDKPVDHGPLFSEANHADPKLCISCDHK